MRSRLALTLLGSMLIACLAGEARSQISDPVPAADSGRTGLEAPPDESPPDPEAGADAGRLPGLTEAERKILERGEYDRGEIIGGGLAGSILGLGTGHFIQGRYNEKGWIFTAGELGSFAATLAGIGICSAAYDDEDDDHQWLPESFECVTGVAIGGLVAWSAFRVWETVDVWAHPAIHNKKVRRLKDETGAPAISFQVNPRGRDGATAEIAVRF